MGAEDQREEFLLDISKRSIRLEKTTFQTRAKISLVLARVDIGGPSHRNPDGEEIACPHIHVYREGYDDKWAYPLPSNFPSSSDISQLMEAFMEHVNIVEPPYIQLGLFV